MFISHSNRKKERKKIARLLFIITRANLKKKKFSLICSMMVTNNSTMCSTIIIVVSLWIILSFATIGTNNIRPFGKKASTNKWSSTTSTSKTIIMPITIFKWYISCTTNTYSTEKKTNLLLFFLSFFPNKFLFTSYWFTTCKTFFSEESTKAINTVWFIFTWCKTLRS